MKSMFRFGLGMGLACVVAVSACKARHFNTNAEAKDDQAPNEAAQHSALLKEWLPHDLALLFGLPEQAGDYMHLLNMAGGPATGNLAPNDYMLLHYDWFKEILDKSFEAMKAHDTGLVRGEPPKFVRADRIKGLLQDFQVWRVVGVRFEPCHYRDPSRAARGDASCGQEIRLVVQPVLTREATGAPAHGDNPSGTTFTPSQFTTNLNRLLLPPFTDLRPSKAFWTEDAALHLRYAPSPAQAATFLRALAQVKKQTREDKLENTWRIGNAQAPLYVHPGLQSHALQSKAASTLKNALMTLLDGDRDARFGGTRAPLAHVEFFGTQVTAVSQSWFFTSFDVKTAAGGARSLEWKKLNFSFPDSKKDSVDASTDAYLRVSTFDGGIQSLGSMPTQVAKARDSLIGQNDKAKELESSFSLMSPWSHGLDSTDCYSCHHFTTRVSKRVETVAGETYFDHFANACLEGSILFADATSSPGSVTCESLVRENGAAAAATPSTLAGAQELWKNAGIQPRGAASWGIYPSFSTYVFRQFGYYLASPAVSLRTAADAARGAAIVRAKAYELLSAKEFRDPFLKK